MGGGYHYNIFYIDTKDIMPENAFDTIKNLALKFNFNPPDEKQKDKFLQKTWNEFVHFLPFNLILYKKDYPFLKKDIQISIIQNYLKTKQDYKDFFIGQNNEFYDKIAICVDEKDLKLLMSNDQILQELKQYFSDFTKSLKKQITFQKESFVNENQILEFLAKDKISFLKLKEKLDYELQHIKQHRPDIVASWKYYQEFEKMCEKLDKE